MTIPDPVYTTPDALSAETEYRTKFEELSGKLLFPAQPETLLTNQIAYASTVTDEKIQYTGEQTLVNFATGSNLDQIGELWSIERLTPQAALTTLEFTLTAAKLTDYLIPAGTRARSADKNFLFATNDNLIITAGDLTGSIEATCTVTGIDANGYAAGQINELFDLVSDVDSVTNLTETNSGSDTEDDEGYRARLKLAPTTLSVAGSRGSYEFWARSADPSITTVSVRSLDEDERIARQQTLANDAATSVKDLIQNPPYSIDLTTVDNAVLAAVLQPYVQLTRFYVEIHVLTKTGLPSSEIITKVRDTIDSEVVRPLTDTVKVLSPTQVNQAISVDVILSSDSDTAQLATDLETEAQAYADEIAQQLGRDIVPSQIIDRLSLPGVYSVTVNTPANVVEIGYDQRPFITGININLTGVADA